MQNKEIIRILHDWNLWEHDLKTGIFRPSYVHKLKGFIETGQIVTITGSRRSGKSFIMKQTMEFLMKNGWERTRFLFVNFEDPRFTELNLSLLQQIYETYIEYIKPSGKPIIFLDEIQEIEGWERWVRSIHELDKAHVVVSGSNAKLLSDELGTLLTGRHLSFQVFPLSFIEYLQFHNCPIENSDGIKSYMHDYVAYGGFPEVVLKDQKKEILLNYFDDIITKDVVKRFKVRKINDLKNLAKYYLTNPAALSSYNALEKFLGLSQETIEKFSRFFEQVYLIFFINRFSYKYREQIKSPKKIYSIDPGLANAIGFRFMDTSGPILENLVFIELMRRKALNPLLEIFYWKDESHKEVDFVVKEGLNVVSLLQVCWNIHHPKTKERELRSLLKAMKEFKLTEGLVITEDYTHEEVIDAYYHIHYLSLEKWLLQT